MQAISSENLDCNGNPVKIGDSVICIDDKASFRRLREGNVYVAKAAYNGEPTVIVDRAYHSLERFKLKRL